MKGIYIIFILISLFIIGCSSSQQNLRGDDIRLFRKTPVWKLAKAVEKQDTSKIKEYVKEENYNVDFQEDKYGKTLLMWAVSKGKYYSTKELLELGADPNLQDDYDGTSAVMEASGYGPNWDKSPDILKLLLEHEGNPNTIQKGPRPNGNRSRKTPLIIAAGCCLEKVNLLIDAGANTEITTEFNESPLKSAIRLAGDESPYITKYLLIDKGTSVPKSFGTTIDGDTISIYDLLDTWKYEENSKEELIKNQILNYLKKEESF